MEKSELIAAIARAIAADLKDSGQLYRLKVALKQEEPQLATGTGLLREHLKKLVASLKDFGWNDPHSVGLIDGYGHAIDLIDRFWADPSEELK